MSPADAGSARSGNRVCAAGRAPVALAVLTSVTHTTRIVTCFAKIHVTGDMASSLHHLAAAAGRLNPTIRRCP